jgi:hypothetical protein
MIAHLTTLSNFLAALSSGLAAYFWYRASRVEAPGELRAPVPYGGTAIVDAAPLVKYAQESGRRNKIAALWSASAALFTVLAWGLGALTSPARAEELGDMDQKWACEVLASEHVSSDKCPSPPTPNATFALSSGSVSSRILRPPRVHVRGHAREPSRDR